jgi:hypothetical protein
MPEIMSEHVRTYLPYILPEEISGTMTKYFSRWVSLELEHFFCRILPQKTSKVGSSGDSSWDTCRIQLTNSMI